MPSLDVNEVRQRLDELAETQLWAHDVADLDSGKILTFPLNRPVAPLSRADHLSQLGRPFNPLTLVGNIWGPSYELTANAPSQYSPRAYLNVYSADLYDCQGGTIQWWPPQQEANPLNRQLGFVFTVVPGERCLVTIEFSAKPWSGMVGHVRISYNTGTVSVPIDAYVSHLVDLTFAPTNQFAGVTMWLEIGIELMVFNQVTFVTLPPVVVGPVVS